MIEVHDNLDLFEDVDIALRYIESHLDTPVVVIETQAEWAMYIGVGSKKRRLSIVDICEEDNLLLEIGMMRDRLCDAFEAGESIVVPPYAFCLVERRLYEDMANRGYTVIIDSDVNPFVELNRIIAREDMEFTREEAEELIDLGAIIVEDDKKVVGLPLNNQARRTDGFCFLGDRYAWLDNLAYNDNLWYKDGKFWIMDYRKDINNFCKDTIILTEDDFTDSQLYRYYKQAGIKYKLYTTLGNSKSKSKRREE